MPDVRERILIVEDEALVAFQIEDVLVGAGFDVVGISDTMADTLALVEKDKEYQDNRTELPQINTMLEEWKRKPAK